MSEVCVCVCVWEEESHDAHMIPMFSLCSLSNRANNVPTFSCRTSHMTSHDLTMTSHDVISC